MNESGCYCDHSGRREKATAGFSLVLSLDGVRVAKLEDGCMVVSSGGLDVRASVGWNCRSAFSDH